MTTQEYSEKIAKLERERDEILKEIRDLKALYLAAAPFQSGDRVLVKHNKGEEIAFISGVEIHWNSKQYDYSFNRQKKDGTMSQIRKHFWNEGYNIIEIEHAPQ